VILPVTRVSDVHVSADGVVVMFHDPGKRHPMIFLTPFGNTLQRARNEALDRTTDSKGTSRVIGPRSTSDQWSPGLIRERDWHGEDGMQHLRTKKEPKQPIPTFAETVTLLMKVSLPRLTV
jgi:phosphatidylglycerol phospholipase C